MLRTWKFILCRPLFYFQLCGFEIELISDSYAFDDNPDSLLIYYSRIS